MPVNANQVKVGAFFLTAGKRSQLRKVIAINQDNQGRSRVLYVTKNAQWRGCAFAPGYASANPPLLVTFARACSRVLNQAEVTKRRSSNIILPNE